MDCSVKGNTVFA